jgi:hypothetical protein
MTLKKTLRVIVKLLTNLHILFLLNGILLASFFFFVTESKYESQLFALISKNVKTNLPADFTEEQFAIKAMEIVNQLEEKRYPVFKDQHIEGTKANIFHPATFDLMTANGACGSYSTVLARILKANDMRVRIGQMKVNGYFGGHMFVEVKTKSGWIVLDPLFNLVFKKANGASATFTDLNQNWDEFKAQVPATYNLDYKYDAVRYTNWEKIPYVTTTIKSALDIFIGKEKADAISVRPYLLRSYHKLAWLTGILLVLNLAKTILVYRKKNKTRPRISEKLKEMFNAEHSAA